MCRPNCKIYSGSFFAVLFWVSIGHITLQTQIPQATWQQRVKHSEMGRGARDSGGKEQWLRQIHQIHSLYKHWLIVVKMRYCILYCFLLRQRECLCDKLYYTWCWPSKTLYRMSGDARYQETTSAHTRKNQIGLPLEGDDKLTRTTWRYSGQSARGLCASQLVRRLWELGLESLRRWCWPC